jgi:hypothetical protein
MLSLFVVIVNADVTARFVLLITLLIVLICELIAICEPIVNIVVFATLNLVFVPVTYMLPL